LWCCWARAARLARLVDIVFPACSDRPGTSRRSPHRFRHRSWQAAEARLPLLHAVRRRGRTTHRAAWLVIVALCG
jgi:hypothetical protein